MSWEYPCPACDAGVDEDCRPDCEYAAYGYVLTGTPPREDSEVKLMAAVHRLPFNSLIGTRGTGAPDRSDFTDGDEWLAALADWMTEYEEVLRVQVQELERQSRDRISMQLERDVLDGAIRRALAVTE